MPSRHELPFTVMLTRITLLVAVGCFAIGSSPATAQTQFEFVQDGTGDVLASLELLNLPASDLADFGNLTFTAEGDSIYGLGIGVYTGDFDDFSGGSVDVSSGILSGGSDLLDASAPLSTNPSLSGSNLGLQLSITSDGLESFLTLDDFDNLTFASASGQFIQVVPEPSSALLVMLTASGAAVCRGRRT